MDRQAFKQRMQNLKSYRENNPGKGYWDWKVEAFQDGGQTGDPEKERFYQATGRSSSGRPLEEGTEQKAYMNQLRTMLKQNGDVQNLDEPVSSTLLKKYLDKVSDSDPIKKMFKQHKNINAYTKWFNTIPLLGTTALGANAYFNNNKDE